MYHYNEPDLLYLIPFKKIVKIHDIILLNFNGGCKFFNVLDVNLNENYIDLINFDILEDSIGSVNNTEKNGEKFVLYKYKNSYLYNTLNKLYDGFSKELKNRIINKTITKIDSFCLSTGIINYKEEDLGKIWTVSISEIFSEEKITNNCENILPIDNYYNKYYYNYFRNQRYNKKFWTMSLNVFTDNKGYYVDSDGNFSLKDKSTKMIIPVCIRVKI